MLMDGLSFGDLFSIYFNDVMHIRSKKLSCLLQIMNACIYRLLVCMFKRFIESEYISLVTLSNITTTIYEQKQYWDWYISNDVSGDTPKVNGNYEHWTINSRHVYAIYTLYHNLYSLTYWGQYKMAFSGRNFPDDILKSIFLHLTEVYS